MTDGKISTTTELAQLRGAHIWNCYMSRQLITTTKPLLLTAARSLPLKFLNFKIVVDSSATENKTEFNSIFVMVHQTEQSEVVANHALSLWVMFMPKIKNSIIWLQL